VIVSLSRKLLERLRRKPYREAYVSEHVRTGVSYQVRALRAARGWAQRTLAQKMGKPQSVVSRLENPDYGKLSLQTLLEVGAAFDVALLIQYVSFPEFIRRTRDVSPEAMQADSFDEKQFRPTAPYTTITLDPAKANTTHIFSGWVRAASQVGLTLPMPQTAQTLSVN
jgi:transcriptional regulator with XRE-family HTH domain